MKSEDGTYTVDHVNTWVRVCVCVSVNDCYHSKGVKRPTRLLSHQMFFQAIYMQINILYIVDIVSVAQMLFAAMC